MMANMPIQVIIGEKIDSGAKTIPSVFQSVDDRSKIYNYLLHYSNSETLGKIFNYQTLRCRPLNHLELNDQFEAKRIGIEKFAGYFFISCYSHCQHEMVSFWKDYGGNKNDLKLLLKFKNFSNDVEQYFYKDYCLDPGDQRIYFNSEDYINEINRRAVMRIAGISASDEYNINTCIKQFRIIDIDYYPITSNVFTDSNTKQACFNIGDLRLPSVMYQPDVLGRCKTEHWSCEQETRIICVFQFETLCNFDYVDMRVKPEIFRDLVVVTNPWATDKFFSDVNDLVNSSSLPDDIKKSIAVVRSELQDQVK